MKELEPVRLDQQITIQQRAAGVDALGQASETWNAIYTGIWASAEPLTGREFFAAGQTQAEVTTRFRIRYRSNIVPTMRVVWRSQPYDIVAVLDREGAKHMLELMCQTGARDGR